MYQQISFTIRPDEGGGHVLEGDYDQHVGALVLTLWRYIQTDDANFEDQDSSWLSNEPVPGNEREQRALTRLRTLYSDPDLINLVKAILQKDFGMIFAYAIIVVAKILKGVLNRGDYDTLGGAFIAVYGEDQAAQLMAVDDYTMSNAIQVGVATRTVTISQSRTRQLYRSVSFLRDRLNVPVGD